VHLLVLRELLVLIFRLCS